METFLDSLTGDAISGVATNSIAPQTAMLAGRLGMTALAILIVFYAIVGRKIFKKAGHKGYEVLVSGHNLFTFITMAGKPGRYFLLLLGPYITLMIPAFILSLNPAFNQTALIVISAIGGLGFAYLYIDVVLSFNKKFKKTRLFGALTILFPFVTYPILAFNKDTYHK